MRTDYVEMILSPTGEPLGNVSITVTDTDGNLAPLFDGHGRSITNPVLTTTGKRRRRRLGRRRNAWRVPAPFDSKRGWLRFSADPGYYNLTTTDGLSALVYLPPTPE
jgi:hypothetical protein